ncbi:hypothetical protein RKE29_00230 [Streptomyces sp. B1866]|uniref:hypothetical protein n=1 Tax=Streptomyces sp. B1866 TaxID=3075431 RepID=UPI002890BD7D|nr:hypothetical protein [Streptomyces sp. B1866]MDT3395098.1 hypothetical protein [Streptomyces sp. B1866]
MPSAALPRPGAGGADVPTLAGRLRADRERRLQRRRRWAVWLAAYGIDVGPRRIHGVRVARVRVTASWPVVGGGWA